MSKVTPKKKVQGYIYYQKKKVQGYMDFVKNMLII